MSAAAGMRQGGETNDPGFFRCYELTATLPGPSRLEIDVYDYDMITFDDFIGRTVVDLEDRWFEQRWQRFGLPYETGKRFRPKPLEERSLWNPTSTTAQGTLRMWVDIMTPKQAKKYPVLDIAPPPPAVFEVRLIVWRARGVKAADWATNMSDLYVTGIMEGHKPQHTDIHWRAKRGKASFNWRMKWDMELPLGKHDFPYLTLQLWDQDILKWSDCLAESTLNLRAFLLKAFKAKTRMQVFLDPGSKEDAAIASARAEALAKQRGMDTTSATAPLPPVGDQEDEDPAPLKIGGTVAGGAGAGAGAGAASDGKSAVAAGAPAEESKAAVGETDALAAAAEARAAEAMELDEAEEDDEDDVAKDTRTMWQRATCAPRATADMTPEEAKEEEDAEAKAEAQASVSHLKKQLGIEEEVHPEHARWLALYQMYKDGKQEETYVGEIQISLEIIPKTLADSKYPNALGRQAPNEFPVLPPPTGRLKLSWNPFAILAELIGEKLMARIGVWVYIVAIVAVFILLMPYAGSVFQIVASIPDPYNWVFLSIVCAVICCPPIWLTIRHVCCVDDSVESWTRGSDDDYAPDLAAIRKKKREEEAEKLGLNPDEQDLLVDSSDDDDDE